MNRASPRAVLLCGWLAGLLALAPAAVAHPLEVVRADHWVYETLYRLAARGLAPLWATSARPLTRMELARMVAQAVERVRANRARLTQADLEDLESLVLEFADELPLNGYRVIEPLRGSSVMDLTGWGTRLDRAVVTRIEAGAPRWIERVEGSSLRLEARATLGLGTSLALGSEIRQGLTLGDDPTSGVRRFYASGELLGASLQGGRDYLWWGPGWRGAFLLSDNTGPLDVVRFSVMGDRLRFVKILGPIDNAGRYLYGMRYDWLPRDNLRVGLGETVVGTGGIYFPYILNPIPGLNYALALWDRGRRQGLDDNYNFSLDFDWRVRSGIIAYGEVLFDDIAFGTVLGVGAPDPNPHRIGGLIGLYVAHPFGAAHTDLRFEHSRVYNWVYTTRRNLNDYVRGGRALGHWCAPDCELWSAVATRRLHGATIQLGYDIVRKGEGRLGETWTNPEEMWSKLYLSGVVETTHTLRLSHTWVRPHALEQTVTLGWYSTTNAEHVTGRSRQGWFLSWEARYGF